jgi:hypothetical protein
MLEAQLDRAAPGPPPDDLVAGLDDLGRRANRLSVPLRFTQRLFILKSHIAQARDEVEKRQEAVTSGARG